MSCKTNMLCMLDKISFAFVVYRDLCSAQCLHRLAMNATSLLKPMLRGVRLLTHHLLQHTQGEYLTMAQKRKQMVLSRNCRSRTTSLPRHNSAVFAVVAVQFVSELGFAVFPTAAAHTLCVGALQGLAWQ